MPSWPWEPGLADQSPRPTPLSRSGRRRPGRPRAATPVAHLAPRWARRSVLPAVAGALLVATLSSSCGLPANAAPEVIPAKQVPFGLLNASAGRAAPATPAVSSHGKPTLAPVPIYLVGPGQRLYPATEYLPAPLTVREVIDQLLASPTSEQAASGLSTDISDHANLRSARVRHGVAHLDFTLGISSGGNQVMAVAQIVYTATAVPGVKAVRLLLQGKKVEAPTGKGTLVSRPVTRADYASFGPRPPQVP